jgi:hypothetical protein
MQNILVEQGCLDGRGTNDKLTLSSVVVDIRILAVAFDRLVEALERLLRVALLHMHTGNLHQTLREIRDNAHGLLQIRFGRSNFARQEPTNAEVQVSKTSKCCKANEVRT